jgi:ECF sigma factor
MISQVSSQSFCSTGCEAMKKRSALRLLCHWSTRSCGVSRAITFSPSRPDHTLESTGLVHEVYLRLLGGQPVDLQNRAHFIAVASRLMRRIFVDYARQRRASKRDGGCRIAFEGLAAFPVTGDAERLAWTTHWTSWLALTSARKRPWK